MKFLKPLFWVLSLVFLISLPLPAAEMEMEMDARRQEQIANRFLPGVETLAAEEQTRLRMARDKALQTPEVQAALVDRNDTAKDFGGVQQSALLKADPKLSPVLDKVKKKNGRNVGQLAALAAGRNGGRARELLNDLSEEERQELLSAFRQIREQPEVSAARQRMLTAAQSATKAVRAMMLKSDPAIQPLLAKLGERRGPLASRRGAETVQ